MDRDIIVVDVETTGLDPERHTVVEVAWYNLTTWEHGCFVPPHNPSKVLADAEIKALQVNRYLDRLADEEQDRDGSQALALAEQLHGNTLAGSNPAFDAAFLRSMFEGYEDTETFVPAWHHRLLDLSAYAAGVLGIPPAELPGLSTVCDLLGVDNVAPHTAAGDCAATAACFRTLIAMAQDRTSATNAAGVE